MITAAIGLCLYITQFQRTVLSRNYKLIIFIVNYGTVRWKLPHPLSAHCVGPYLGLLFLAAGPFVRPIRVLSCSSGSFLYNSAQKLCFRRSCGLDNLPHKTRAELVTLSPSLFCKRLKSILFERKVLLVWSEALLMSFP